ncbi:Nn.00g035620.m01.CDS01 [Neocucurbitaria sp. VM-36]
MCHWVLRVWKCGESGFTKYSSCSFDRAAHDPNNLLNPLHPSITPSGAEKVASQSTVDTRRATRGPKDPKKGGCRSGANGKLDGKSRAIALSSGGRGSIRPTVPVNDDTSPPTVSNGAKTAHPRDGTTGEVDPLLPLSEIGKASRFGDQTLGANSKCSVFEVVLQTKETTACPACARSPRRARLPAHARGCFGLS